MKPNYLILICFFISIGLWGQESEEKTNKRFVGGTINYTEDNAPFYSSLSSGGISSSAGNYVKNQRFSIAPYWGKRTSNHWVLGFGLNYELSFYRNDSYRFLPFQTGTLRRETNGIGGKFFGRYTLNPQKKLQFYLQPYIEYTWRNFKSIDPNQKTTSRTAVFLIGIPIGLRYQLNDRFGIIAQIGQISYKYALVTYGRNKGDNEYRLETNFNPRSFFWGLELNF